MRNIKIAPGEYYHIFNRGMHKQVLFHDKTDWVRFLFLILYFQSPVVFQNISRVVKEYVKHSVFNIESDVLKKLTTNRYTELTSFSIMPNHFHLIIKELGEGGIARYMQRVLNSYTKYYNTKYQKSGHLFQGPYKAVHVENNNQLLHLSAYIHRNPREIAGWLNKEDKYEWSTYQDFIGKNRFSGLVVFDIIGGQFENQKDYHDFVRSSPAKLLEEDLPWLE